MLFDDRLATVLRHRAEGELAARTQYRQLLDLLGNAAQDADDSLVAAGHLRLAALAELIAVKERARIVADNGARIRNPDLVAQLAEAEPDVAGAALANARLTAPQWVELIPDLPIRARGFLRHRRDLPEEAVELLDRLGVRDRVLPEPIVAEPEEQPAAEPLELVEELAAAPAPPQSSGESIGALVERIQAYTRARDGREADRAESPRLPLGESERPSARAPIESFIAGIDTRGRIELAEAEVAPMVVGTPLFAQTGAIAPRGPFAAAFYNRLPVRDAEVALGGSARIAGDWLVDATPRFHSTDGRFTGYAARFRRPVVESAAQRAQGAADRIRQLLHELRTPVNAIQGFAEVIQQQLFGATPHEYRALAAAIAGDAAHMLAGFDELDRLAKLESGALHLEPGRSDFASIAQQQVEQLQTVLSARVARFDAEWPDRPTQLAITDDEASRLAWRMFATVASATGAGEKLALDVETEADRMAVRCTLPATLAASEDIFSTETRPLGGAVSASIFGAGFALRLARAEARAAGGDMAREDNRLVLTLPLLTASTAGPSAETEPGRATG